MPKHDSEHRERAGGRCVPADHVLFRLLREQSHEPVIVLSRKGEILHASRSVAEYVGERPEALAGAPLAKYFRLHPTDQEPKAELLLGLPDGVQLRLIPAAGPSAEPEVTTWTLQNGPLLLVLTQVPTPQAGGEPESVRPAVGREEADAVALEFCETACRTHNVDEWSEREREIVRLVSHGMTTKQIARELGISSSTVDKHRNSVTHKAGVETSAQLGHLYAFLEVLEQIRAARGNGD